MTEENNGFSWDAMTTNDYKFSSIPKIDGEGYIELVFLDNAPCKTTKNKYNTDTFLFEVSIPKGISFRGNEEEGILKSEGETRIFGISSIKLMEQLKNILPIKDEHLKISVSGTGYDTVYKVEEL